VCFFWVFFFFFFNFFFIFYFFISGFSSVSSENTVTIGGVECAVTGAMTTSVTCNIGNGPMGQYNIIVLVEGKGQASGSQKEFKSKIL
jgi:hypothetical protein